MLPEKNYFTANKHFLPEKNYFTANKHFLPGFYFYYLKITAKNLKIVFFYSAVNLLNLSNLVKFVLFYQSPNFQKAFAVLDFLRFKFFEFLKWGKFFH